MDDSDWKLKQAMGKVPVLLLNSALEFPAWQVALRRLVASYNMIDALLYTIPERQMKSMEKRFEKSAEFVKKEFEEKEKPKEIGAFFSFADELSDGKTPPVVVDLTQEVPLHSAPKSEKDLILMKSMGISPSMDAFFSSTTAFTNYRTGTPDTVKEAYFRQEIWLWMEASLAKGQFKYLVKTIEVIFDIHALYLRVVSLANKASWISHAIEYRKIFTMATCKW